MTEASDIDSIVLTIIQAVGLLLPVVLFTVNYISPPDDREWTIQWGLWLTATMILSLTLSGFLATIGVLKLGFRRWLGFFAVLSLAVFFLTYGIFILINMTPVNDYIHEEYMR